MKSNNITSFFKMDSSKIKTRLRRKLKVSKKLKITPITKNQLRNKLQLKMTGKTCKSCKKEEAGSSCIFKDTCSVTDLICSICMELLLRPFSLPCGHTFCFACLDDLSRYDVSCNSCPCCRNSIGESYPMRNKQVDALLQHHVKNKLNVEEQRQYLARNQKQLKRYKERSLDEGELKVGGKIDVRIGNRWQVGTIKNIFQKEEQKKIQVVTGNQKQVYVFSLESTHIARYLTFAKESKFDFYDTFSLSHYLHEFSMIVEEHENRNNQRQYFSYPRLRRTNAIVDIQQLPVERLNNNQIQRVTFFDEESLENEENLSFF